MLHRKFLIVCAALCLVLAACGGGGDDEVAVTLGQSLTSRAADGGLLTASIPEGWTATESNGTIVVATSAEALNSELPALAVGQAEGSLFHVTPDNLVALELSPTAAISDILGYFIGQFDIGEGLTRIEVGENEQFTAGGKDAESMTLSARINDLQLHLTVVVISYGNGYNVASFATSGDDSEAYQAEFRAIAISMEYSSIALTEFDLTAEASPEVSPEVTQEAVQEATQEATAEITPDVTPETTPAGD